MNNSIFVLVAVYLTLAMANASEGSGGTTGGGNNRVSAVQLIPNSVLIRYVTPIKRDSDLSIPIGVQRVGGFDTTVFAHYLRYRGVYTKDAFLKNPTKKQEIRCDGWYGQMHKQLTLDFSDEWHDLSGRLPHLLDYYKATYYLDGEKIKFSLFRKELEARSAVVINQIDLLDAETLKDAKLFENYLRLFSADISEYISKPWLTVVGVLSSKVQGQADEIKQVALASVDDQGQCKLDTYTEMKAKLRQFTLGSKLYFAKLQKQGVEFSNQERAKIQQIRYELSGFIDDTVRPFCETTNERLDLLFE